MKLSELNAVSPIDGRYRAKIKPLAKYFSEFGWIQYRIKIEVEYFIALCQIPLPQLADFDHSRFEDLRRIYQNFEETDALLVKEIEQTTNHDIKAVEYFIKQKFEALGIGTHKEFIHFGLTSQDINNTSIPLLLKDALQETYLPQLQKTLNVLKNLASVWADVPMLARTHGQPASPTRLGKELGVFVERLESQIVTINTIPNSAKFGGATGNFNAHFVAYPQVDWVVFANKFCESLGLNRSQTTTQIEHYDNLGALLDNLKRINTILIDLSRDVWQYVSLNYFKQKIKAGEVGSSAMPHKVNPIDFENAEGNLGIANALFEHLSQKLPISRLQRDLTDSTVLRNVGVPIAHSFLSFENLQKGLNKLELNELALQADLADNWAVVAEAIQTILRRENYPNPYEALKALTRTNAAITEQSMQDFINQLDVSEALKDELRQITPYNYLGVKIWG
jgi:adenylosuccinate lyase